MKFKKIDDKYKNGIEDGSRRRLEALVNIGTIKAQDIHNLISYVADLAVVRCKKVYLCEGIVIGLSIGLLIAWIF